MSTTTSGCSPGPLWPPQDGATSSEQLAWLAGILESRGSPVDRLARDLEIAADVTTRALLSGTRPRPRDPPLGCRAVRGRSNRSSAAHVGAESPATAPRTAPRERGGSTRGEAEHVSRCTSRQTRNSPVRRPARCRRPGRRDRSARSPFPAEARARRASWIRANPDCPLGRVAALSLSRRPRPACLSSAEDTGGEDVFEARDRYRAIAWKHSPASEAP